MTELSADTQRLVSGADHAHVATLLRDESPHTVPVWIDLCLVEPDTAWAKTYA